MQTLRKNKWTLALDAQRTMCVQWNGVHNGRKNKVKMNSAKSNCGYLGARPGGLFNPAHRVSQSLLA